MFEVINQLDLKQLNLPIMDIKTLMDFLMGTLTPFLKESKAVKEISNDISEASNTTLSALGFQMLKSLRLIKLALKMASI